MTTLVLPDLHPGQQEVWASDARFKVVCCGRRWGKTHLGVLKCIVIAAQHGRAWWVAPAYPVASIGWRLLKTMVQPIPGVDISESERRIVFPPELGGGEIQIKSADNPDSLRGEALDYVVMDEAAQIKPDAWYEALRPTLSDRRGGALFIGTPKGQDNWFYDLYQRAEKKERGWEAWQKPTSSNPFIDEQEIEDARTDQGALVFAQEYLAEFVVGSGLVFKPEWENYYALLGDPYEFKIDTNLVLVRPEIGVREQALLKECIRFATVDVAASTRTSADYTVIASWARTPSRRLCLLDVYRERIEAPDIVPWMRDARDRWKLSWLNVEKSAFQLSLVQLGQRAGLPIQPVLPDKDKWARALHAAARMASGHIWFPKYAHWLDGFLLEVRAFDQGRYDDQVDVLSYAADISDKIAVGPQLTSW